MGVGSSGHGAEKMRRLLDRGGRTGILVVGGISLIWPEWVTQPLVQWAPWGLALICFGLAHGGIDHRLPSKGVAASESRVSAASTWFYVGYLGAMAATLWLWWVSATAGWLFFLAISVYHFGQGDLYWSQRFGLLSCVEPGLGGRVGRSGYAGLFLLIRGSLPVLLPLFFFSEEYEGITRAVGAESLLGWGLAVDLTRWGTLALWGVVGIQVGGALILVWRGRQRWKETCGAVIVEAGETFLLLWFASLAPPILSIGTYFVCWHSPRHVARLVEVVPDLRECLESGRNPLWALVAFHRIAAPMTIAAGLLFLLVWWGSGRWGISVSALVGPAIFFISAITVPHVLIVSRLDHSQQIWGWGGAGSTVEGGVE
jgi:Brp/Blh family beta-carotene 15,15'-monooxygenase